MVEPLGHRQTKEAETDMFDLKPPRHTSTLPKCEKLRVSRTSPLIPYLPTCERTSTCDVMGRIQTCASPHPLQFRRQLRPLELRKYRPAEYRLVAQLRTAQLAPSDRDGLTAVKRVSKELSKMTGRR